MNTLHSADQAGILSTAEDYIQGWYHGDPVRMTRCLHPQLAKRRLNDSSGLDELDAPTLIGYVQRRAGTTPPATQLQRIEILGVYSNIASVRVEMNDWVDFLHLGRFDGEWKIVNALWALKVAEERQ